MVTRERHKDPYSSNCRASLDLERKEKMILYVLRGDGEAERWQEAQWRFWKEQQKAFRTAYLISFTEREERCRPLSLS